MIHTHIQYTEKWESAEPIIYTYIPRWGIEHKHSRSLLLRTQSYQRVSLLSMEYVRV